MRLSDFYVGYDLRIDIRPIFAASVFVFILTAALTFAGCWYALITTYPTLHFRNPFYVFWTQGFSISWVFQWQFGVSLFAGFVTGIFTFVTAYTEAPGRRVQYIGLPMHG